MKVHLQRLHDEENKQERDSILEQSFLQEPAPFAAVIGHWHKVPGDQKEKTHKKPGINNKKAAQCGYIFP
jgi:hypothetical protein